MAVMLGARRPPIRALGLFSWTLCLIACNEDPSLLLRLRTDLVAEADYGEARVVVSGESVGTEDVVMPITRTVLRSEGRDVLLGEVGPLPAGDYRVSAELWTEFGSRVAANQVLVQVTGFTVVTVPITADCAGLTCPGRGDAADATFCLGGTCVPEVCREDRSAAGCPAAECAVDGDCTSAVDCAEPRCDAGVCVTAPNDGLCEAGQICSARLGCLPADSGTTCTPGSCDDFNPCTDDVCGDAGCEYTPNTASCDDGVFCNGVDTCAAGRCDMHAGDPCAGLDACDEAARSCGASSCAADQRVSGGTCVACAPGTQNGPGDDPSGPDTTCDAIRCGADERVLSNACFPCPAGTSNAAGDDASGPDTTCTAGACAANERVVSNTCVACPPGESNGPGDDPSGPDTSCTVNVCAADFRVESNMCVPCIDGETNAAGDPANGPDTTCDCMELLRTDGAAPYVEWYARGNGFDSDGSRTFANTDFYRQTLPARANEVVGGTTRLVIQDFLNHLYWNEFSRPIEPAGLAFWTDQYVSGASFAALRTSILAGATEETTTRVTQSCGTLVSFGCGRDVRTDAVAPFAICAQGRLYTRDATGRGIAEAGFVEYFTDTALPGAVARDITYGALNAVIDGVYRDDFGRPADCAGLAFWAQTYVTNPSWTLARLRTEILAAAAGTELGPCSSDGGNCVDFVLDNCGVQL